MISYSPPLILQCLEKPFEFKKRTITMGKWINQGETDANPKDLEERGEDRMAAERIFRLQSADPRLCRESAGS
jgi:hypothetical protein